MSVPVPEYVPDFRPTHVVPRDGLDAWQAPDPGLPTAPLDAFLPVRLEERAGDWGRVLCSNGWTAWVDARLLVTVPDDPPAAGRPTARTADPRPLIARAEDALGRYRRAAEALGAGRLDGEDFRQRTRGLRVGMVVDGESVWLYDAEHERWVYCDGLGLSTYAASSAPSIASPAAPGARRGGAEKGGGGEGAAGDARPGDGPPGYEPTQVVVLGDPPTSPETGPPPLPAETTAPPAPAETAAPPPTEIVERPPTEIVEQPPTEIVERPPPTEIVERPPPRKGGEE